MALPAVGLMFAVAAVILDVQTTSEQRDAALNGFGSISALTGLMLLSFGAVVIGQPGLGRPRRVGWVMVGAGLLWSIDGMAESWQSYATRAAGNLAGADLAFWIVARLGALLLFGLPLLLLLYPTGELLAGRWRAISLAGLATTALIPLTLLVLPIAPLYDESGQPAGISLDPVALPVPHDVAFGIFVACRTLGLLALIIPVAAVFARYRTADGRDRQRLRWLLWACAVDVLSIAVVLAFPGQTIGYVLLVVTLAATGGAITIGLVRPDLLDIDRLLGITLVYGGLAVAVVALDIAVLGLASVVAGEQLDDRSATIVGLLLVTIAYGPLRAYLWRLVRRSVVGRRDDPYGVVSNLAMRLEQVADPADQLPTVAQAVAEAFKVGFVRVEVDNESGDQLIATFGKATSDTQTMPITYRSEEIGRLVISRRGVRSYLSQRDEALLGDVVRQAALAARASQSASRLQQHREEIVLSREDERRRLRRDLHDGLGPTLAAVVLRIDTARQLAQTNAARSEELLLQAKAEVGDAMADIRRLVHDLRPPALDDVGLLGAVEQQADRAAVSGLRVEINADGVGALPAAVEVAAYRIVSEALNNVVRHASASECTLTLMTEPGGLSVSVADNGVGIAPERDAGVGLLSLRERAAELGGWADVSCPASGGTLVRAWLPMADTRVSTEVTDA